MSVAKLLIGTFMKIKINDLPRHVYFKDRNSKNVTLQNLTFFPANKIKN